MKLAQHHILAVSALLATSLGLPVAHAQTAGSASPAHRDWSESLKSMPVAKGVTLSISGQARWREEFFRGFNMGAQNDDYAVTRLMLGADLQAGAAKGLHGRVLAEVRDAQALGRTLPGGTRATDGDRHDIQNLYADIGYGRSFVRYGRQELSLGRERLVGVPDWANTRRGSSGTRAQLVRGSVMLEAADVHPMIVRLARANGADRSQRLRTISIGNATAAVAVLPGLPLQWQAYRYEQQINSATSNAGSVSSTRTRRNTTGARALWQFGAPKSSRHVATFELEGAAQRGRAGVWDLRAWFWVAEGQLQFRKVRGVPTFSLGLEEASGDSPATATRSESFTVLYPAAHQHGGFADVIGRPNVREVHLIGTWDPAAALSLRGAWFRVDRLALTDGVYNKQTALFRAPGGSSARHVADEVDLTAAWKATAHLRVLIGGATVLPGAFLTTTPGGAHVEHWGYVGTTYAF